MRLFLLTLSLCLTAPAAAYAEDAAQPEKVRKICRETPARTGSNRPGKRICRTAAEWKELDQAEASFDGRNTTTSSRSSGNSADK
jgi:hypothetical protein